MGAGRLTYKSVGMRFDMAKGFAYELVALSIVVVFVSGIAVNDREHKPPTPLKSLPRKQSPIGGEASECLCGEYLLLKTQK